MSWLDAALWGAFGGFAVEGLELYTAVRRHGHWPWRVRGPREVGAPGYVVAELIRLIIGAGLAGAAEASGQITSAVGALAVGVAAPLIVERLARAIPLTDPVDETGNHTRSVAWSGHHQPAARIAADNGTSTAARPARAGRQSTVGHQRVHPDGTEPRTPDGLPGGVQE